MPISQSLRLSVIVHSLDVASTRINSGVMQFGFKMYRPKLVQNLSALHEVAEGGDFPKLDADPGPGVDMIKVASSSPPGAWRFQ